MRKSTKNPMSSLLITLYVLGVTTKERLTHEDRGATAVEYGLMVGLIAVVIIIAVTALGTNLTTLFNSVANKV